MTTKGELVRSILYPPPADFKFETDSYKFIGVLAVIAMICVFYTIVSKVNLGYCCVMPPKIIPIFNSYLGY